MEVDHPEGLDLAVEVHQAVQALPAVLLTLQVVQAQEVHPAEVPPLRQHLIQAALEVLAVPELMVQGEVAVAERPVGLELRL
ncbi:hypothetical protein QKW35_19735 [Pontibacterium granulatum]|uniref:hypothetical protein n=1 Tax=Pontibacterium granulatum TaxID=2036029 RepID=UPI00249B513A|nr:hypothetical protein [Pontibacterium granulatum]MDI3326615.1 hypothetical protein [Pontibacterium granulatum]